MLQSLIAKKKTHNNLDLANYTQLQLVNLLLSSHDAPAYQINLLKNKLLEKIQMDKEISQDISYADLNLIFSKQEINNTPELLFLRDDFSIKKNNEIINKNEDIMDDTIGPMNWVLNKNENQWNNQYAVRNSKCIVFRFDTRSPGEIIKAKGFHPRKKNFPGFDTHTKGATLENLSGGVSTSSSINVSEDFQKHFGAKGGKRGFIYRIKLEKNQAIDVNATNPWNRYPWQQEMLVDGSISLEQIEVKAKNGKWYNLEDIANKKLRAYDDDNSAMETCEKYLDNIFDNPKQAQKEKRKLYSFYRANVLVNAVQILENHDIKITRTRNAWEQISKRYYLQCSILALEKNKPSLLNNKTLESLIKNPWLPSIIVALSRSDLSFSEYINEEKIDALEKNELLQKSIYVLWHTDPSLVNEENLNKLSDNLHLQQALAGTLDYMIIAQNKSLCFIGHSSVEESRAFIKNIIEMDKSRLSKQHIINEAQNFIEAKNGYTGKASGSRKNSRRTILGKYLDHDFSKKNYRNSNSMFFEPNSKSNDLYQKYGCNDDEELAAILQAIENSTYSNSPR